MKKICLLLLFVISLFGCHSDIYYWEFNHDYEEISQIKIIEIIDELEFREIKEIDLGLADEIYNDITKLTMKRYGTNLSAPFGKCFLIVVALVVCLVSYLGYTYKYTQPIQLTCLIVA